jgi:hypothetical protein
LQTFADSGPSAGDKIKMRKMQERMEKTDAALKEAQKELKVTSVSSLKRID